MLKALASLLVFLIVAGGVALGAGYIWLENGATSEGPMREDAQFTVKAGDGLAAVATRLEAEGLISDARIMKLRARISPPDGQIKTGEYLIPAGSSIDEIMGQLIDGKVILRKLTIPEGLTVAQVLKVIAASDQLEGEMPDGAPSEGTLLPDTYLFPRGETRAAFIQRMSVAQDDLIEQLWPTRRDGLPLKTKADALNLASIVQKEAAGHDEYGRVASVFINRLKRGIPLQTDPTVHYGVNKGEPLTNRRGQRRTLYRSELDTDTPWNTYTRAGLPQTPISNPGRDALKAVLNPPETDFLYFVADGKGGTTFTRTLAEHQAAVRVYREYEAREIARERAGD